MKIWLEEHHKDHARAQGHPEPPHVIDVKDEEYFHARDLWKPTLQRLRGFVDEDELHMKAICHLAHKQHHAQKRTKKVTPPTVAKREIVWVIVLLLLILLFMTRAHADVFSKIKTITLKNSDGTTAAIFASPFTLKLGGSGCTWGISSITATLTCSGGPGGSTEIQVNGVDTTLQTPISFNSGSNVTVTNPSNGNVSFAFSGTLAATKAAVTHQFLTSYDAATGLFTIAQPAYADISGTPTLAATKANVANQWFNSYDATTGAFTSTQPGFTNLSGSASCGQLPALTGDVTTSGCAATLASVVGAGTCGDATHSCGLTIDAKGRITTFSNNVISGGSGCPLTTKGDLCGYDSAAARIPVGRDRLVITADSSSSLGVKWQEPLSRPSYRIQRIIIATGSTISTLGDSSNTSGTVSANGASSTAPAAENFLTGSVAGNTAGWNGNPVNVMGKNLLFASRAYLPSAGDQTATRIFIGYTDQTTATMTTSTDVPAGNYSGFMFSPATGTYTGLTDTTNWVCVQKDNTTQTAITTGVAGASTSTRNFMVVIDDTANTITYFMDGVQVCSSGSNRPTAATALRMVASDSTTTTAGKNLRIGYLYSEMDQ